MTEFEITTSSLSLVPISRLMEEKPIFYVPAYQRGYRWTTSQVEALLNDLLEFQERDGKSPSEFYCLQPLVVKRSEEGSWRVVDGQQRLTTIYLILNYFNQRLVKKKVLYSLQYETRPNSAQFLIDLEENKAHENIDFHHMYNAFKRISEWFDKRENLINDIEGTLLNRVKFIWYELGSEEEEIEVFTRLNIGKIPLTNAELVKALFLRSSNFDLDTGLVGNYTSEMKEAAERNRTLKQVQIATEWDRMEATLQQDSFWYFVSNHEQGYSSRIELIFELMIPNFSNEKKGNDPLYTFLEFQELFTKAPDFLKLWQDVKETFLVLEEWYQNHLLYHYVGFLLMQGTRLYDLLGRSKALPKSDFKKLILDKMHQGDIDLSTLTYEKHKGTIRTVLLLFNIQSLVDRKLDDVRFPFASYKKDSWDLEHVRSIKAYKPEKIEHQISWMESIQAYFIEKSKDVNFKQNSGDLSEEEKELLGKIQKGIRKERNFDEVYDAVLKYFKEDNQSSINEISNLVLLDSGSNRGYRNSVFPVKRKYILDHEQQGFFVPECTRRVFLKYYTQQPNQMLYWQKPDQEDYHKALVTTLKPFINNGNND